MNAVDSGISWSSLILIIVLTITCWVLLDKSGKMLEKNATLQAQVAFQRSADYFAAVPDSLKTCEMWRINDLAKENMKLKERMNDLEGKWGVTATVYSRSRVPISSVTDSGYTYESICRRIVQQELRNLKRRVSALEAQTKGE